MKQTSLVFISFLFTLSSCGPSTEEIAAKEKAKQDSMQQAKESQNINTENKVSEKDNSLNEYKNILTRNPWKPGDVWPSFVAKGGGFTLNVDGSSKVVSFDGTIQNGVWKISDDGNKISINDIEYEIIFFTGNYIELKNLGNYSYVPANGSSSSNTSDNSSSENNSWKGIYQDEYGKKLRIDEISSMSIFFRLKKMNSVDICRAGTAYLNENNLGVANYYQDDGKCHLNFTFQTWQIEVHEYDCTWETGCGQFDGVYKRK